MNNFILQQHINSQKDNIREVSIPFCVLSGDGGDNSKRKMAVFLGANFRDLPGADLEKSIRLSNQCLDYMRRECAECDFYYKPHPAETDEATFLDLSGFKKESTIIAELFYIKNAKRIKYVFSACSGGCKVAHAMGFNSYVFVNLFNKAFDQQTVSGYEDYFEGFPRECFINDFGQPLRENKKILNDDKTLENNLQALFSQKRGNVWILLGDPAFVADVVVLRTKIREIAPEKKINLVINRHHRWDAVPTGEISGYFDKTAFFPRVFYSMRPKKIIQAVKVAREIKKFPIQPGDIIFEFEGLSFMDNCFASYFRKNTRIAMMVPDTFNNSCGEKVLDASVYRRRFGAKFFNLILEPILGLERTHWFEDKRRVTNVYRYIKPVNDIFNHIWIFKSWRT